MRTFLEPRHSCSGFTLLEIAIVLLIVGIITSFVGLSLAPLGNQAIKQEAQKLARLIEYASQEAILRSTELNLALDQTGYQFHRLEQDNWVTIDDGLLKPRKIPEQLQLDLSSMEKKSLIADDEKTAVITLYFLSSGETSPFEITLSQATGTAQFKLTGDGMGNVQLKTVANE